MAVVAQLAAAPVPYTRKTERVLKVQPLMVSMSLADSILELLNQVASERTTNEMTERLRRAYQTDPNFAVQVDPVARDEAEFIARNVSNPRLLAMAQIPSYQKYTFLAPSSNVQFDNTDFKLEDFPKDLDFIWAHADGINGRFIDIHLQTKFKDFNEVRNWQLNKIVIQGEDHNWVHAIHEKFRSAIEPEGFAARQFIYKNCLPIFWLSFVFLLFAEYRAAKWLYPNFSLQSPLSGTGAIVMFAVLAGSILVFGNVVIPIFTYWFPYSEVEGNLSRSRTSSRTAIKTVLATLYSAAFINTISIIFGPAVGRWIH
jgi:hypothetical protein